VDIPRDTRARRRLRLIGYGVGITVLVTGTAALSQLEPAAPSVDRSGIWVDTVAHGTMVRQVRGPGTLVPEEIRFISALTSGRVEQILVEPGAVVAAETPLFILSNPEVPRLAMDARRQLANARSQLISLQAQLENDRLAQELALTTARTDYREASRKAEANRQLAERGLIPQLDFETSADYAAQLAERVQMEQQRLDFKAASTEAQLAAQRSEIDGLEQMVTLQDGQVDALVVRAGTPGVLRELTLQEGEWISQGAKVAVVVQPGKLKAQLRIPETQIKDVVVGQTAAIDTRNGIIPGRVVRIDPGVASGTVTVDVALDGELPAAARPDLSVDGTIEIERIEDVTYAGRPAYGQAESTVGFFRLDPDGRHAQRVSVNLGRTSVNSVEIRNGLRPGDVVILSDMSQWDEYDRVRLK
jgi:HlyD family secretion protein